VIEKIKTIVARETWVLDGNFEAQRELVWQRADTIVWLNYAFFLVAWRVLTRNVRWCITQEAIWSHNRITLRRAFSGIRHSLCSFAGKRRRYPQYLREVGDCEVLIFDSPQATAQWLASL
jgi:hypothetical protein